MIVERFRQSSALPFFRQGELGSQGLELILVAADLLFGQAGLGDVLDHGDKKFWSPADVPYHRDGLTPPNNIAVFPDQALLGLDIGAVAVKQFIKDFFALRGVFREEQLRETNPLKPLWGIPHL